VAQLVEALRYEPEGPVRFPMVPLNPSDHTMALVSARHVTEMSTTNISWVAKMCGP
jgi:hypothetical protein